MRSMACLHADSDVAVSPESSGGRRIERAPWHRAAARISSSSEDSQTPSIAGDGIACLTDQAANGRPQTGVRFLRGRPLDPPRAGMIATARISCDDLFAPSRVETDVASFGIH